MAQDTGAPVHLGLPDTTEQESQPTINTTPSVLIDADPMRQELIVVNGGSYDLWIGLTAQVTTGKGIRVAASGGQMILQRFYDHSLTGRRLYALAETAAQTPYVLAVTRYREG